MRSVCIWLLALLLAACSGPFALDSVPDDLTQARQKVVGSVIAQIGTPYRYGGANRRGFDAAGLCQFVYGEADTEIPRYIENQRVAGTRIGFDEARPGDLLFYHVQTQHGAEPSPHVGVYIGDGEMVHAAADRDKVSLETVDNRFWRKRFVTAVSFLP